MEFVFTSNGVVVGTSAPSIISDELILKAHEWVNSAPKRAVTMRTPAIVGVCSAMWVMKITAKGREIHPKAITESISEANTNALIFNSER